MALLIGRSSVSRVLSRTTIYLVLPLLTSSSGCRLTSGPLFMPISLQQAGFTFSACHHATLWALTPLISPLPVLAGSFVSVALSLRLPAVAVSDCLCPVLPGLSSCRFTDKRPSNELPKTYYTLADCFCRACSSRVLLTIPSANWLNSRWTWLKVTLSNCFISSRMRS